MTTDNPHKVALSVLENAIAHRLDERSGLSDCNRYDQLSSEIGQLRTTRRMIVDGSLRVPHPVPEWFGQFADQLANMERHLTDSKPEPGPVAEPVSMVIESSELGTTVLERALFRDAAGTYVTLPDGTRLNVFTVHFARSRRRFADAAYHDALIYNWEQYDSRQHVRILRDSGIYSRWTTCINHLTLRKVGDFRQHAGLHGNED